MPPPWLAAARALAVPGERHLLGIAGPPGAGKSTFAARLTDALGPSAVVVPMDGFHLAQAALARLGRAERKGAPDTFDVDGYTHLLTRLRHRDHTTWAPAFDRDLEEPVAGSIEIGPTVALVVTEGSYLLHDGDGWQQVRPLLDACWWVDADDDRRERDLVARHVRHGRTPAAATSWVARTDRGNAALVQPGRCRADRLVARV